MQHNTTDLLELVAFVLGESKTRAPAISDHFGHELVLFGSQLLTGFLDILLGLEHSFVDIHAHRPFDLIVPDKLLGLVGSIAELLGGGNVLIESDRGRGVVKDGLAEGDGSEDGVKGGGIESGDLVVSGTRLGDRVVCEADELGGVVTPSWGSLWGSGGGHRW